MLINRKNIKNAFGNAEKNIEFCWRVLHDLKNLSSDEKDIVHRLLQFQDRLAETIFDLNTVRQEIIKEEKKLESKRTSYKLEWYRTTMKRLSIFKDGIDNLVNICKALGDAYAYFFYRSDAVLLEEHLSHERIVNNAAGIGERGELEFVKNFKHFENEFFLYHGITNILRYGDFSLIDLQTQKVSQIAELKTKQINEGELQFSLTLLKKVKKKASECSFIKPDEAPAKNRKARQIQGLADFLKRATNNRNDFEFNIDHKFYHNQIEELFAICRPNKIKTLQVSPGLAFSGVRFKKTSFFSKIFHRNPTDLIKNDEELPKVIRKLVKSDSMENSITLSTLLYDRRFIDHGIVNTTPLFWYPLSNKLLKQLYFIDFYVISLFNPIHVIEDIKKLGFLVESRYTKLNVPQLDKLKIIQRFDLFIPYITNYLQTESFIIDAIKSIEKVPLTGQPTQIILKHYQQMMTINTQRNSKKKSN